MLFSALFAPENAVVNSKTCSTIPAYTRNGWFRSAVRTAWSFRHEWRCDYRNSHWYKFQEAIKAHQNTARRILEKAVFSKLDLEKL
ncbi:MAG: hypothetical protein PHV59_05670 [Victivallales bacterium]|nr:hypothetical protein [Victivallales bacterium]